jgi:hemerythrin-like domain-containing protein
MNCCGLIISVLVLASLISQESMPKTYVQAPPKKVEEIPPTEDLMREHGILNRILIIYDEVLVRLEHGQKFNISVLAQAAGIIRSFVEDYHEKLEEKYVFPRLEKAGILVHDVKILKLQHDAGRKLTATILSLATPTVFKDELSKHRLQRALRFFVRMYRTHEAREDTEIFPAFRKLLSPKELDDLAEEFEESENKLFGENGFETMVKKVINLEKKLGINALETVNPSTGTELSAPRMVKKSRRQEKR